jgi:DNA-binding response OmpR family regulator
MKILVIEDELELNKTLVKYLTNEGYIVESVEDFDKAIFKVADHSYDCILVDITLPKGNGLDIIKQLKADRSKAGIIIISAKNSDDDKISGLDLGADDYLSKPFNLAELNSRIKALFRRKHFDGDHEIIFNELTIKPDERIVSVNGQLVILTGKEFDLLLFFLINKNKVVSKITIAEHLWGDENDHLFNHDFIYVHLRNLRKKLNEKGCQDYIQTIYGIGYKFNTSL